MWIWITKYSYPPVREIPRNLWDLRGLLTSSTTIWHKWKWSWRDCHTLNIYICGWHSTGVNNFQWKHLTTRRRIRVICSKNECDLQGRRCYTYDAHLSCVGCLKRSGSEIEKMFIFPKLFTFFNIISLQIDTLELSMMFWSHHMKLQFFWAELSCFDSSIVHQRFFPIVELGARQTVP
jgi:hypothetical protein